MMSSVGKALLLSYIAGAHGKKIKIEAMEHDIQQITPQNFDGVISKFRDSAVSSVWYFDEDNKADQAFFDEYNKLASDLKGMMKVTAVSCSEYKVFCNKNNVKETPHVQIFPTNPIPPFKWEGKLEAKAIGNKMSKLVLDQSTIVTKDNVDAFATGDPTKPKVFLFSDKKAAPTIFKALSSETVFRRSIKFGFVSKESAPEVVSKYKVSKFPTIIMQRGSKAEIKETYKGDMTYSGLQQWINLHSESGMGDKVQGAGGAEEVSVEEAKPWLVQEVPELTAKSQADICFKGEGLCVIYLKDGSLSNEESDMLVELSKKFTSQLSDRGAKMKWMWIDLSIEAEFKKLFNPSQLPSAVVFNPHKRLRFASLDHGEDGEVKGDKDSLSNLMDKVLGGDARFKMVPGQKLPSWAKREEPAKGKKEL